VTAYLRQLGHRKLIASVFALLFLVAIGLLIAQDQETLRIKTPLAAQNGAFPAYLARLLGHPLTQGDAYVVHTDGGDAFSAMLAAIDGATSHISLETYIFASDQTGRRFADALERAGRRDVRVRVVLDSLGANKMNRDDIARLERAGVRIGWYNRVASFSIEEANYRTHRKELVVDGRVAFVGGMGLADQWARTVDDEPRWRDTQIELRGPVVDNIEAGFNENWIETGGIVEPEVQHAPGETDGSGQSIVVWSSPEGGANSMKLLYLLAIAAARHTLDIESPYVITDESTRWSLRDARNRGVRVRILMEGDRTDAKPVKFAGRAEYETLLQQGIELYEYQPSMMHAKALIVDGVLSIVGSANFDNRSLELNDELNVAAFDTALAARLLADFERDRQQSKKIDLESWRSRPIHLRAREQAWSLFGEIF
jgi:cardiolipin synthase A/B